MDRFRAGDADVLISTTVIEVGRRRAERDGHARGERGALRPGAAAPAPRSDRPWRPSPRRACSSTRRIRRTRRPAPGSTPWCGRPTGSSSPTRICGCAGRGRCSTPANRACPTSSSPGSRRTSSSIGRARARAFDVVAEDPGLERPSRAPGRARSAVRRVDRLALPLVAPGRGLADVRVIAGTARGMRLAPVPPGTRPISDMAREGLFASLGSLVEGARCLDLYAGTGATGIEALSRGAAGAVFVDRASRGGRDRPREPPPNALRRGRRRSSRRRSPAGSRKVLRAQAPFDLVLCDPPYALEEGAPRRHARGARRGMACPGGLDRRRDPRS